MDDQILGWVLLALIAILVVALIALLARPTIDLVYRVGRVFPARWRCKWFGHQPGRFRTAGGWPEAQFRISSSCQRCRIDTSVSGPSSFVIYPEDPRG